MPLTKFESGVGLLSEVCLKCAYFNIEMVPYFLFRTNLDIHYCDALFIKPLSNKRFWFNYSDFILDSLQNEFMIKANKAKD